MTEVRTKKRILAIHLPALNVGVEAGYYDFVVRELRENLGFVREWNDALVRPQYENAEAWRKAMLPQVLTEGTRAIFNRSHPMIVKRPYLLERGSTGPAV